MVRRPRRARQRARLFARRTSRNFRAVIPAGEAIGVLGQVARARVAVAGDLMLDEYIVGTVSRISPEAPVPAVEVTGTFHRPGGAAHVAHCLAALGASAALCGVVGDDPAGAALLEACRSAGVDAGAVARGSAWSTVRKVRVLSQHQQLLRMDWEAPSPVDPAVAGALIGDVLRGRPGAVVLSDYAKGFLTPEAVRALIEGGAALGAPVLVDPKRRDFSVYRGAQVITPNLRELEAVAGRPLGPDEVADTARAVLDASGIDAMVVTLGAGGMCVVERGVEAVMIPAERHEVYDVTGAGDVVIAVLALGLACGASLPTAARLANAAAGVAVGRVGTAVVAMAELIAALDLAPPGKVLSPEALAERLAWWRLSGRRVVFTNGCFDLLHAGHVALLQRAAALGDVLLVGLNSDASVARLKGPGRPTVPWSDRAALLAALSCVDGVAGFDDDTPLALIEAVRPDVLVKGADYRIDEVVGREAVEASGGRVELVTLEPGRSTTALIARLRQGP